ncbi:MAG TPA: nitrate reductase molybdenum cofactor assembly chaperone [Solirubrobacteraceae bacterium]
MTAYKLLSLLLCYPDADLHRLRSEIAAAAHALPNGEDRTAMLAFLDETAGWDLEDAQEAYVGTFDFNRRASLHLTYPYQGDRRQRGVALLKLRRLYTRLGLTPITDELPDYLPLMLELADMLDLESARELLSEFRAAIELCAAALDQQHSPYRHLLTGLRANLEPASEEDLGELMRLAAEGPPSEQVGLDPFAPPDVMPTSAALAGGTQ